MTSFQKNLHRKFVPTAVGGVRQHRGMMLIEVLVSVLILAIGVLGLISAFANTTTTQTDVDNRALAARYTEQILSQISLGVNRTTPADLLTSLLAMAHNATPGPSAAGVPAPCSPGFTSAPSSDPIVTAWIARITASGPNGLPGATADMQQIVVDPASANRVTVTVCWQSAGDPVRRQHVQRAYIN